MSESSAWSLIAVGGPDAGKSYPLTEQGMHMGRSDECELVLASQNVSRKHARVFLYQGEPYVQDLGSRNGVFVNGMRVQQLGLKGGDTVTVGEFVFQIGTGGSAAAGGGSSRKRLMFAVAGVLVLFLVGAAVMKGRSRPAAPAAPQVTDAAPPSEVKNMFASLEKTPKAATGATTQPPAAVAGGSEAPAQGGDRRNEMVREYLDRAQLLQDAGKLTEAKEQYERALKLDPSCSLCLTRRERITKEISGLVQRHLDDGMKAFKALRYEEAISSWELVLNLSPDPGSQAHQQATRYIADARAKLESQRY